MKKRLLLLALALFILFLPIFSDAEGIQWQSYKDGIAKGKAEGKKIFVNFYADW
jgi:thiol:disulfide interchange protein